MPAEIELKLALDYAAISRLPALLRDPALTAVKRGRGRTTHLVSTYFDTADLRLAREGV
ncbi:MAG: CYTH domain-containing protein, partial [Aromatoleum sp.]|nr:CYTH domain-containing protein [Aromatoleum sp.]